MWNLWEKNRKKFEKSVHIRPVIPMGGWSDWNWCNYIIASINLTNASNQILLKVEVKTRNPGVQIGSASWFSFS